MDANNRLEFDNRQRPNVQSGISIVHHVTGRIRELKKLYNDIGTTKSDMLLHQMLPNSMRRRAMSHNPKRLPLKYRKIHTNQMAKSGPNIKKRRPSRKYRRKPSNLMKEFMRRKQKNVWLETHVWHAKRYHMKELWGYKIPYTPTDKRYRASYRAAANHCLVQDMSFVSAIEISAPLDHLKENFGRITSRDCGPTMMAKCYQSGSREGEVDLFQIDAYPTGVLARVSFMWKPDRDEDRKTLWIFIHPTAYQEVLETIINLFHLKNVNRNDTEDADASVVTRNDSLIRNPRYANVESNVEVIELKETINRLRLTGPYANAVLGKALKPATNFQGNWLGNLFETDQSYHESHSEQERIWNDLERITSPSEISPQTILGLNAVDPRSNRPARREKSMTKQKSFSYEDYLEIPPIAARSGIWSKEIRDTVTKGMMTTGELCKLRNNNQLVPGLASSFEDSLQPIPLLLIQRPGSKSPETKRLGLGNGWDVIVPGGYGMSVWLSLIKCGAKSGGWREVETITYEMGSELFLPDTVSGMKEKERQLKLKREEYFRRPPNKRTNYIKMGITSPFSCPFSLLVKEWNGSGCFHLLRNRSALREVSDALEGKKGFKELTIAVDALIPINIKMEMKGTPGDFGIICLPSKRDIKNSLAMKYQRNRSPLCFEPAVKDDDEKERKVLRQDHKKQLKRLKNRRLRAKRKLQATANHHVKIQKSTAEKIIQEQHEKISEMWLPKTPMTVRNQCSKQVIGYLSKSRFTLSEGKVCGLGYVTRDGFSSLMNVFQKFKGLQPFVLTRATNSNCYHSASIIIQMNL